MLANWITLSRFPLLLICTLILYRGSPLVQVAGAGLLFLGLMLDTVDGIVARKTGQTSLLGSVLDIAPIGPMNWCCGCALPTWG
jgi:phosphatidylglycerophosphate synthase